MIEPRMLASGVHWAGVVDWSRRLFDALIPLPDGTSYNAYLVQGSQKNGAAGHGGSRLRRRMARAVRRAGSPDCSSPTMPSRITPARCPR